MIDLLTDQQPELGMISLPKMKSWTKPFKKKALDIWKKIASKTLYKKKKKKKAMVALQ
jgi:hypothetical protein